MDWLPYILVGVLLLMAGLQLRVLIGARGQRGRPAPAFDEVVDGERDAARHLLYFFSPACGPCRSMTPRIEALAGHHPGVCKVDVSEHPRLAREFRVMATPTTVLVDSGVIRDVLVGNVTDRRLESLLR